MTAAAPCRQRRWRSSLVVHVHVVGGEATWAALTLMHVWTPVSQGSSGTVSSRPVLGRVIRRADIGGHTQQPLTTVGDVAIIEHFVKWSTQALKTMTNSSGLSHDHQHIKPRSHYVRRRYNRACWFLQQRSHTLRGNAIVPNDNNGK